MTYGPSPMQMKLLQFIYDYQRKDDPKRKATGLSPTHSEMMLRFNLTKASVRDHITPMVRKGLLRKHPKATKGNLHLTTRAYSYLEDDNGKP